mmetsp:Transcript_27095/g.60635  ORF Transcript_27095/g.60635 Transcript_27095/m.60635 type:complete len:275 (-) Transcript_27095:26-850(-)
MVHVLSGLLHQPAAADLLQRGGHRPADAHALRGHAGYPIPQPGAVHLRSLRYHPLRGGAQSRSVPEPAGLGAGSPQLHRGHSHRAHDPLLHMVLRNGIPGTGLQLRLPALPAAGRDCQELHYQGCAERSHIPPRTDRHGWRGDPVRGADLRLLPVHLLQRRPHPGTAVLPDALRLLQGRSGLRTAHGGRRGRPIHSHRGPALAPGRNVLLHRERGYAEPNSRRHYHDLRAAEREPGTHRRRHTRGVLHLRHRQTGVRPRLRRAGRLQDAREAGP